jgi:hypothetical protein
MVFLPQKGIGQNFVSLVGNDGFLFLRQKAVRIPYVVYTRPVWNTEDVIVGLPRLLGAQFSSDFEQITQYGIGLVFPAHCSPKRGLGSR